MDAVHITAEMQAFADALMKMSPATIIKTMNSLRDGVPAIKIPTVPAAKGLIECSAKHYIRAELVDVVPVLQPVNDTIEMNIEIEEDEQQLTNEDDLDEQMNQNTQQNESAAEDVLSMAAPENKYEIESNNNQEENQLAATEIMAAQEKQESITEMNCTICGQIKKCYACENAKQSIKMPLYIQEQQPIMGLGAGLIDLQFHNEVLYSFVQQEDGYRLSRVDYDSVFLKNYQVVFKSDYNNFPIIKQLPFTEQTIKQYQFSENARESYGNVACKQQTHGRPFLQKIICDNDLSFQGFFDEYYTVALDIETYNLQKHSEVPVKTDEDAFIGMCCLTINQYKTGSVNTTRYAYINDKQYHIDAPHINILRFNCEQAMAVAVLNHIASLGGGRFPVLVLTFNGSWSQFSKSEYGYDIPWLLKRAHINNKAITQIVKMTSTGDNQKDLVVESQILKHISGLHYVYFIDVAQRLQQILPQDTRNQLQNYKLETYLEHYGLRGKEQHDYVDLQRRLSQPKSDISDIVIYCQRDCDALFDINSASGMLDSIFAIQKALQIPLSFALYESGGNNITTHLMRKYTQNGYTVSYYPAITDKNEQFKGAYTYTNPDFVCKVTKDVLCLDFVSLYPHAMISANACLTTYLSEAKEGCNTVDLIDIHPDDTHTSSGQVHFDNKSTGLVPALLQELFQKRKQLKTDMKAYDKKSNQYQSLNVQQNAIKIILNTIYGLCGNSNNPLFWKPLAEATTAYGRLATITAKKIIQNTGVQILGCDTDSVFSTIPTDVNNHKQLMQYVSEINKRVQTAMNSKHLVLETEEIMTHISFADGKKSYLAMQLTGNNFLNWQRSAIDVEQLDMKIRGCPWGKMENTLRSEIKKQLQEYLLSETSGQQFYNQLDQDLEKKIRQAISNKDMSAIEYLAERVKLSSAKSQLVRQLKACYYQFIKDDAFCSVMLTLGSGSKTTRKIPVQLLHNNMKNIDVTALKYNGLSAIAKLLLTSEQKKSLPSYFKIKLEENEDLLMENHILVHITKKSGQHATYMWNREQLQRNLAVCVAKNEMVDELVRGSRIRLFFDIDSTTLSRDVVQQRVDQIVQQHLGELPHSYLLESRKNDLNCYHLYYDVTVEAAFAKEIANHISNRYSGMGIDTGVYNQKSLRMPNSIKIKSNRVEHRAYLCDPALVGNMLITPYDQHKVIHTPLSRISSVIIDPQYRGFTDYQTKSDDLQLLAAYLVENQMPFVMHPKEAGKIYLTRTASSFCSICQRQHDSNNAYAIISEKYITIYCQQDHSQPLGQIRKQFQEEHKEPIKITKKQADIDRKIRQIEELMNSCQNHNTILKNAVIQDNKHLQLDIAQELQHNPLLAIKSGLGTGKSHQVGLFLEKCVDKVLIISHRISYTADIASRYNGFSVYSEINKDISLSVHNRAIVQVESLQRVKDYHNSVVIIDEVESILTQLSGHAAKENHISSTFCDIIQNAKSIIAMDGFLQQTTIEMLNTVVQQRGIEFKIHHNIHKPFSGQKIILKPYRGKAEQDIMNDFREALISDQKVVSMCTSNELCQQISEMARNIDKRVAVFHGQDLAVVDDRKMIDIKREAFGDVANAFTADLLIYTSSITAGVNYDRANYNVFKHIYVPGSCDAFQFIQGIARCRQYSEDTHTIYWQHKQEHDYPKSPKDVLDTRYNNVIQKDIGTELDIWLSARKKAIKYYRSQITITMLREMGYELEYQHNFNPSGSIQKSTVHLADVEITPEMVAEYDNIRKHKNDKSLIQNASITLEQYKKIALLTSVQLDPLANYSKSEMCTIQRTMSEMKQFSWINKLVGDNSPDYLDKLINLDVANRKNNMAGIKQIDITRVKDTLESVKLNTKIQPLLQITGAFNKDKIIQMLGADHEVLKSSRYLDIINKAAAFSGVYLDKQLSKRTAKGGNEYTFKIVPLMNNKQ